VIYPAPSSRCATPNGLAIAAADQDSSTMHKQVAMSMAINSLRPVSNASIRPNAGLGRGLLPPNSRNQSTVAGISFRTGKGLAITYVDRHVLGRCKRGCLSSHRLTADGELGRQG
jgi:hypothetical protein